MNKVIKTSIIVLIGSLLVMGNVVFGQSDISGSGKTSDISGSGKPDPTKANTTTNKPLVKLDNPLNADSIEDVIYLGIDILIYIGVAFAIFAIIFTGFKFVWAQGNPGEIEEAKKWFFNILIGLAILISSRVIVQIVKTTLQQVGVVKENKLIKPIQ